jgi:hypothetical protein
MLEKQDKKKSCKEVSFTMLTTNSQAQSHSLIARLLLACGAIGPLLFILVFLAEDLTRPGYSPWRNFVSALSLSNQGWEQIANFLICGVLAFCFAFGLHQEFRTGPGRIWGPLLLGTFGLSLIVAGLFVTDPAQGYPPGVASTQTLHGIIHGTNAPIAFGSLTAAIFVMARRFLRDPVWRKWGMYSLFTGLLCIICFVASLTAAVLDENGVLPNAPAGLFERISIIGGWAWISLLALWLLWQGRALAQGAKKENRQ